MAETFDVLVVGGRCAGAPLATLLARQGLRVGVVEKVRFPRDTLSTHVFQAPGIRFLQRLGVLEDVRATGAPTCNWIDGRSEDFTYTARVAPRPGDAGAIMSVRRMLLDPILLDAARRAGAKVMEQTRVTDVVSERGRVCGVRVQTGGSDKVLQARLVVGADGRNSTVGKLVGSRKYNVVPGERMAYWSFFEGVRPEPDPPAIFHRWEGRFVIACPADSGLYQVIVIPEASRLPDYRADLEGAFMEHARSCAPVADRIAAATRVGKIFGIVRFESFFRESAGRGWALVGDAGCFKDPSPGQGITDAFRQVDALAPAIAGAIHGSEAELDAALTDWASWRDRDADEHYWLATDLGTAGIAPMVLPQMLRRLHDRDRLPEFIDILQHRMRPSAVMTPPRLIGATASLLMRPGASRSQVLREVGELMRIEARRRRLMRHHEFVDTTLHADAGETEVPA